MDEIQDKVNKAIESVMTGDPDTISKAFSALGNMKTVDLLAELCVSVDEAMIGKDTDKILNDPNIPSPDNAEKLLEAVKNNDLQGLYEYSDKDFDKCVASLIMLIIALRLE